MIDTPLPNFCEAISRFGSLEKLSLTQLNFSKINEQLFLEYVSTAPNLKTIHLDRVEVSSTFQNLLDAIDQSNTIQDFRMAHFPINI